MPKTNWDGAEEPTIKNFYKIDNINFEYALKRAIDRSQPQHFVSTEVNRNAHCICDKRPRGLVRSTSRDICQVEKIN